VRRGDPRSAGPTADGGWRSRSATGCSCGSRPEAGDVWVLIDPPDQILRLEKQDPASGTFQFLATAEGEGRVVLVARDCPPPLPVDVEGGTPHVGCPTGGAPGEADAQGARPPLTDAFAVTVVVTEG
jgi:hypothetical protein